MTQLFPHRFSTISKDLSFQDCFYALNFFYNPSLLLYFTWTCCNGGWWRWALVTSPDRVAPIWMVGVSASVNLTLHHKVQKFSSGTGSPGWSRKKGRKTVVVVVVVL